MIVKVKKRDGTNDIFQISKIINALRKAFIEIDSGVSDASEEIINKIAVDIANINCIEMSVENIQDIVEQKLMQSSRKDVAKAYIRFRYKRELARKTMLDETVLEIVENKNEYWNGENSNKNPRLNTTIRDYLAGAISTSISRRLLLPKDIIKAHDDGVIHFHDMDYNIQKMHNCCLVNLDDMLQNGTVISEVMIEKPKSFSTACNVATQIIAQVASSQYGGQSISLAHLVPFVDISRQKIKKEVTEELYNNGLISEYNEELLEVKNITESRLSKEIKKGIQIIQYQITTLMTTNGQTPFITLFMYLNEAKDEQEKKDLALLIEEVLKQSIQGVKNEEGVWVTPVFPKIIYVLQEDNITEDSKYWYLTKLAAKCSLKRLTPDYISEKVMKELKDGNCFPVINKTCA